MQLNWLNGDVYLCAVNVCVFSSGFTDLSLNDQMRLLQSTWAEILTLTLTYRSLSCTGKLRFASDFTLDEKQARECGAIELYQHVSKPEPKIKCLYYIITISAPFNIVFNFRILIRLWPSRQNFNPGNR
jgi:hypothetical protein